MSLKHVVYPGTDLGGRVEAHAEENDEAVSAVYSEAVRQYLDAEDD